MVTRARAGFTLLEVAVAVIVLGAVLTTVAEVIQWSAAEHRAAQRKRAALEAATTLLDKFTVRDWSAITPENAAALRLQPETTRLLVNPRLVVTVAEEKEPGDEPLEPQRPRAAKSSANVAGLHGRPAETGHALHVKRISIELTWAGGPGRGDEHVRLSTWIYAGPSRNGLHE